MRLADHLSGQPFNWIAVKLKLASVIRTYFATGGKHVQFIVCDAKALEDPKIHPEDHRDLMLPVAGYSTYSVQLTPGLQDEAITRTDQMLYES